MSSKKCNENEFPKSSAANDNTEQCPCPIFPNSLFNAILFQKDVNISSQSSKNNTEAPHENETTIEASVSSLTPQFHVDALRAQHEYGPLGARLRRGRQSARKKSGHKISDKKATNENKESENTNKKLAICTGTHIAYKSRGSTLI